MNKKDAKELFQLIGLYRQKMNYSEFKFTKSNIYQLDDLMTQLVNKSFRSSNDAALNGILNSLESSVIDFLFEVEPDIIVIKRILDIIINVLILELKGNREAIKSYFYKTDAINLPRVLEKRYLALRYINSFMNLGVKKSELLSIIHGASGEIQLIFENKINRFLFGYLDQILCQEFMTISWNPKKQMDTSERSNLEWFIDQLPRIIEDEQKKLLNAYRIVYQKNLIFF